MLKQLHIHFPPNMLSILWRPDSASIGFMHVSTTRTGVRYHSLSQLRLQVFPPLSLHVISFVQLSFLHHHPVYTHNAAKNIRCKSKVDACLNIPAFTGRVRSRPRRRAVTCCPHRAVSVRCASCSQESPFCFNSRSFFYPRNITLAFESHVLIFQRTQAPPQPTPWHLLHPSPHPSVPPL